MFDNLTLVTNTTTIKASVLRVLQYYLLLFNKYIYLITIFHDLYILGFRPNFTTIYGLQSFCLSLKIQTICTSSLSFNKKYRGIGATTVPKIV